jgi:hypothetical protein
LAPVVIAVVHLRSVDASAMLVGIEAFVVTGVVITRVEIHDAGLP